MTDPTPADSAPESFDASYPLRVATRVTGLKAELLRAWETRYGAIQPERTPGGSRRYSLRDLDRLRLLRDVVAAGHRIGRVAHLADAELAELLLDADGAGDDAVERILRAADGLDAPAVRDVLDVELERRGAADFATGFAIPLLVAVGDRWEEGRLSVSAEHLVSSLLRATLTDLVARAGAVAGRPELVLATPPGESHDLGTLVAAIVAAHAGARLSFLGADIPVADLAARVAGSGASVLVLGVVTLEPASAAASLRELRDLLPPSIRVWIGGAGIRGLEPIDGVERLASLGQLEAHVLRLGLGETPELEPERVAPPRAGSRTR